MNYSRCAAQQCGFQLDSSGNLTAWVNNWINANVDIIDTLGDQTASGGIANLLYKWSTPKIPAGTSMTITLQYVGNSWVKSSEFAVVLPNGVKPSPVTIDYSSNLLSGFPAKGFTANDYLGPICVLQMVIVGFDNKADAKFNSGAGTINVSAGVPLVAGSARPSCSNNLATLEQSNILYGPLSSNPRASQTQTFCASSSGN